jgi:hypothetical protein
MIKFRAACFSILPMLVLSAHADSILKTAGNFGVLGGSAVTNTGATTVTGDVGVSPGSEIDGGITINGTFHQTDATASQAQTDLTNAYLGLQGLLPTNSSLGPELGGLTLTEGVYSLGSADLNGILTLNFQGLANQAVIFQIKTSLETASGPASGPGDAQVVIENPGSNDALYWVVGNAIIGTYTQFEGNILSLSGIVLKTGATIGCGRALNQTPASVTMDTNTISNGCAAVSGEENSGGLTSGGLVIGTGPGGVPTVSQVPEPGSFVLLSLGVGVALLSRRFRSFR